jgi:hypothetical protein
MQNPPLPPWSEFSGSQKAFLRAPGNRERLLEWVGFLHSLSPDELLQYVRDYPAPSGWEKWYEYAASREQRRERRSAMTLQAALIAKCWQSTTLK